MISQTETVIIGIDEIWGDLSYPDSHVGFACLRYDEMPYAHSSVVDTRPSIIAPYEPLSRSRDD